MMKRKSDLRKSIVLALVLTTVGGGVGFAESTIAPAAGDTITGSHTFDSGATGVNGTVSFTVKDATLNASNNTIVISGTGNTVTASGTTTITAAGTTGSGRGYLVLDGATLKMDGTTTIDTTGTKRGTSGGLAWEGICIGDSSATVAANKTNTIITDSGSKTTIYSGGDCGIELWAGAVGNYAGELNIIKNSITAADGEPGQTQGYLNSLATSTFAAGSKTTIDISSTAAGLVGYYNEDNSKDPTVKSATYIQEDATFTVQGNSTNATGIAVVSGNGNGGSVFNAIGVGDKKVELSGTGATGVNISGTEGYGDFNNLKVNLTGSSGTGIYVVSKATGNFDNLKVTGTGDVVGALVNDATLTAKGSITTEKGNGLVVTNNSTATLENMTIKVTETGIGALGTSGNGIAANNSTVNMSGAMEVGTAADYAPGINLDNNSKLNLTGGTLNVTTSGGGGGVQNSATGLNILGASVATLAAGTITTVVTAGASADGICLVGTSPNLSQLDSKGTLNITTAGDTGEGIESHGGIVNLDGTTSVTATAAHGLLIEDGSTLNLNGTTTVDAGKIGIAGMAIGTDTTKIVAGADSVNTITAGTDGIYLNGNGGATPSAIFEDNASSKFDITLKGNANGSSGIHVANGASATTAGEINIKDTTGASDSKGIYLEGATGAATMTASGTTTIELANGGSGVVATGAQALFTADKAKIDITSGDIASYGVYGEAGAKINLTSADSSITMSGNNGQGVYLDNATANLNGVNITTSNHDGIGRGYLIKNNAELNISGTTVIDTSADNSAGASAWEGIRSDNSKVNFAAGSDTTFTTGKDCGMELVGTTTTVAGKLTTNITGGTTGNHGIIVSGGTFSDTGTDTTINMDGKSMNGLTGSTAANITFDAANTLKISTDATGNGSITGISLNGAGTTFKSDGDVQIDLKGLDDGSSNGIKAASGASVTLAKGNISAEGTQMQGVLIDGTNSKADLTDTNIKVVSTAGFGQGLAVMNKGDVILKGTSVIDTSGSTGNTHEAIKVGEFLEAGGTFTADTGSNITLKSGDDTGLELWEGSTANLNGTLTVEKNGKNPGSGLNAIANKGSILNLNSGSETIVNLTGDNTEGSQGLYTEGTAGHAATTTIDANAKLTITTDTGTRSNDGIEVNGDAGVANLVDNAKTDIDLNAGGRGAYIHGASGTATFNDLTVNVTGGGTGDLNNGVYVAGQGTANLTNTKIDVTNFVGAGGSQDAVGINMDSGIVNIAGDDTTPIDVKVANGDGMVIGFDASGTGTVNLNSGKLLLDVTTNEASGGASWHNGIENYGTFNAAAGTTLEIKHDRTTGSVDPTFGKEGGIVGFTDSKTNLNGTTTITMSADDSAGITYDKNNTTTAAEVKVGSTGTMDISGSGANMVGAEAAIGKFTTDAGSTTNINLTGSDAVGISALSAGAATVNGDLHVVATTALKVGDGNIDVNQAGDTEVQLTGNLIGDTTGAGGVMNVQLNSASSFLTGAAHNANQKINMKLGKSAPWNVTGSSEVTDLENTSLIDMSYTGNDTYETITTETYSGAGGTINMDVDLGSETNGDKLMITTSGADGGTLKFRDASLTTGVQVTGEKTLLVVGGAGAAGTAWTTPSLGSAIGNWDKEPTLEKGSDGNWYLIKVIPMDGDNTGVQTILSGMDAAYGNWRAAITDDTLRKRLGDLRHTNEEEGIWARIKAGKLSADSYAGSYQMYQVGYDKKSGKDTYYGLAVDHVRNSNSLASGKSEGSLTGLSLYATNYHPSGAYSDLVLRAGKSRSSVDVVGSYPTSMDYDNWTYNASYELGKTYTKENGWFAEPEMQVVYGYMQGGDYAAGGSMAGLNVHKSSTHSLLGRVGAVFGRKLNNESDYYAKVNLWREFAGGGDTNMAYLSPKMQSMGLTHLTQTFGSNSNNKDTWLEVGLGGNVKLSKKTYLYGDILKTFGADVQKTWQVNAGVRWNF